MAEDSVKKMAMALVDTMPERFTPHPAATSRAVKESER